VLDFYAYTSRPELPLYAEALQADYKKIGVDLQIKIIDYHWRNLGITICSSLV